MRLLTILLLLFPLCAMGEEAAPASSQTAPAEQAAQAEAAAAAENGIDSGQVAAAPAAVPAGEENPPFDVYEYRVEGNTVLPQGKVEEAVYPYLGERRTIADVEGARGALEKAYQSAGYLTVFVNIPEQQVDKGVVRLQVQESSVERLRVTGSRYYSLGEIRERVPGLAEGSVPYFPDVQKQLATVNRTGDRQVAPLLRPGKAPGTVEVELKVQDKLPFHGGIELNNRYTQDTTHTRLSGSLRYDNLWQLDHSLGISFQVTPENTDETKVLAASYLIPRLNGDYVALYGVVAKSNTSSVTSVGNYSVAGDTNILGLRYINTLPSLEHYFHSLTMGLDYKDFTDSLEADGGSDDTPISYLPFTLGYDGTLQDEDSLSQMTLGLNFAVRGLGSDEEDFSNKRFLASSNYAYLKIDLKHTHKLPGSFDLFGRLQGQVASGPLISSEQFTLGGVDSVRGYLESNSLGDNGVQATLELRSPSLTKYISDKLSELYVFAFADAGHAKVLKPLPEQDDEFNLASLGAGLRMKSSAGFSGALDYAQALHTAGEIEDGDSRLHFRVGYDW